MTDDVTLLGIDLAWGTRRPDGWCQISANQSGAVVRGFGLSHGDDPLLEKVQKIAGCLVVAVDAPLICHNQSGARPVDRLTHVHFGSWKCGCYPANLERCPRPASLAAKLQHAGLAISHQMAEHQRMAFEVYPHPAMVRWFGLSERIPYKKGKVVDRRREFARLQWHLANCLAWRFPKLEISPEANELLRSLWCKDVEDQTDALVCALIAYWHWLHRGQASQILGDPTSGLLVVPSLPKNEPPADHVAAIVLELANERGASKTFCPSEVARRLAEDWRPLMPWVRQVASELCLEGKLQCTQKGAAVEPLTARGAIRFLLPQPLPIH